MGWFLIIQCFYFYSVEYIFKGVGRTLWISVIYHSATKIKLWLPTWNSTSYTCLPVLCCCNAQLQNLCAFLIINILETWMWTYFFLVCSVVGKGGCWQTAFPITGSAQTHSYSGEWNVHRAELVPLIPCWAQMQHLPSPHGSPSPPAPSDTSHLI